jgi:hypothetical protein
MLTQLPMANVIIVLAIALGVIVVVDMVVLPAIEVDARGCTSSVPFEASKGHCFKGINING